MRKVESTNRCRRKHGEVLGQVDARVLRGVQKLEESLLLAVVGTSGITRCGADADVLLLDELLVAEILARTISPELATHAAVEILGKRLRQTISEGFDEDTAVVIIAGFELLRKLFYLSNSN